MSAESINADQLSTAAADPPQELPNNVSPLRRSVKNVASAIRVRSEPETASAYDQLRDMLMGDPPLAPVREALSRHGYHVGVEQLTSRIDPTYTSRALAIRAVEGAASVVYLAHIPAQILDGDNSEYLGAFSLLERLFPKQSTVRVCSSGLLDPRGVYLTMMEDWQVAGAEFISWRRLTELEALGYVPRQVVSMLKIDKALPKLGGAGDGGDHGDSISDHFAEITRILQRELERSVAKDAYLRDLVVNMNVPAAHADALQGIYDLGAEAAATRLVNWSDYEVKESERMLGRLMAVVAKGAGWTEKQRLWALIEKYQQLPEAEIERRRANDG